MGVSLVKFIDMFFGVPYCFVLGIMNLFRKKDLPKKESTKTILVIQLWGIGETILTVPAIKALKQTYRKTTIEVLCTSRNKEVYFNYPFISKLNVIKPSLLSLKWFTLRNFRKYDIVIDMEEYLNISAIMAYYLGKTTVGYSHGVRSLVYTKKVHYDDSQHVSKTFFDLVKALGVKGSVQRLEPLHYTGTDQRIVELALRYAGIRKNDYLIGIAPGAAESSRSRMWPRFAELIEVALKKHKKAKVVLVGADYEKAQNEAIISMLSPSAKASTINLAGKLSLRQLFSLTSRCDVFVGNDSGPMHVAAAMNIKTIGLFGPNLPVRFGPFNKKSKGLYHKMPCSPCINVHKRQVPECMYGEESRDYQKCMKAISVKEVVEMI